MKTDHVLIIGFGGPEKPEDVRPFLQQVTRGISIPEARLKIVEHHYEAIGGASPYNRYTFQLVEKLKSELSRNASALPVFVGMRNWHPFLKETLSEIKRQGFQKGLALILAPHRSDASFEKYIRNLEEAKKDTAAEIEYEYLPPWFDHPLWIKAQAEQARKIYNRLSQKEKEKTHLFFTAHSIPVQMASQSKYVEEIKISSAFVAKELGHASWSVAYQSRSGNPRDPWLEPDILAEIQTLPDKGIETAMLIPIGFLCDNAEVLYDLDIEAHAQAQKSGLRYLRSSTVMDHPLFVQMLRELIQKHSLAAIP